MRNPFLHIDQWLEQAAEASAKRRIVQETLLPNGQYEVIEIWPSRADYEELCRHRKTLEAMRTTARAGSD